MRRPAIAASSLAATGLILLAACGGSSSNESSKSTTSLAPNSTIKATKGGDFCKQVAATYNEAASFAKNTTASADELRTELEKSLKDGQDAIEAAPAEVKPDLQTIQDAVRQFSDTLAKVGYDLSRLGPDALAAVSGFSTPQFQQASAHSVAYVKDHCGIDLGTPTTSTP